MMGREKRARLLVPSFIVAAAATAAACGGTSMDEPTTSVSGAGTGGQIVATNPPPISYGGSINPPVMTGGGSGNFGGSMIAGGSGNFGSMNPPPLVGCPQSIPANGSACPPSSGSNYECDYNVESACVTTLAFCTDGTWRLAGYAVACPTGGAGGGEPIEVAGAAGEGPSDPELNCPPYVPSVGTSCYKPGTVTSYQCDFATSCGSYEATCNGHWLITFQDAPGDSCFGGAAGE